MVECCKCGERMYGKQEVITVLGETYCGECFMDMIYEQDPADVAERLGYDVSDAEDFYEDGPINYFTQREMI